jgi:hypothetical protein
VINFIKCIILNNVITYYELNTGVLLDKKIDKKTVTLLEYLEGGILSNCIILIFFSITFSYRIKELNLIQILILNISKLMGSMLSGYLLGKKKRVVDYEVGIYLGLSSYIFYIILSSACGFWENVIDDIMSIINLILGSIGGLKIAMYHSNHIKDSFLKN